MVNEFEQLDIDEEAAPVVNNTQQDSNSMIDAGSAGVKYDWSQAPDGIKAPPRIDLDGKTVTIKKAEIILPPKDREWALTKGGDKKYKYCNFIIYYDIGGQQESFSGCRVFQREGEMYSHPTIMRDRVSQSSRLLGVYADYKKKEISEVSLREFMGYLNSQPKAVIKAEEVKNPTTGEKLKKNLIGKFI